MFRRLSSLYHRLRGAESVQPAPPDDLPDWDLCLGDSRMDPRLKLMLIDFIGRSEATITSAYWSILCRKNVVQLLHMGYENFKQTVALNYFTWVVGKEDPQAVFLTTNLPGHFVADARRRAQNLPSHEFMTREQSTFFDTMTYLLWEFTRGTVGGEMLQELEEPAAGNPPAIELHGRKISQDLANSVLEYHSILRGLPDTGHIGTITEIGGGYGRTAYVFLRKMPWVRYIMADIPPALYIAERYLTGEFPDRKVFRYRPFNDFADVQEEFRAADLVFLMPDQLQLLPDNSTGEDRPSTRRRYAGWR